MIYNNGGELLRARSDERAARRHRWRAYLAARPSRRSDEASAPSALDAAVDWSRLQDLLPLAGVALSGEATTKLRDKSPATAVVATAFQGLRPRAARLLDVARAELGKGAHGRADAALTAALERPKGLGPLEAIALLLRGLIRLGSPETDERTLIDPETALRDLNLAARRMEALADGGQADDPAGRETLVVALLAAAWAAYCAGEASRARDYADRAAALAPQASAAIYLAAKAAASGGETELAAARLAKALTLDPALAEQARADADFDRIAEARDDALARLSADAIAALEVVERARRRLASALAQDGAARIRAAAPDEVFLETPRPPRSAPCAAVVAVANLARQALTAVLRELDDRLAQERVEANWRLRDASDRRCAAADAARRAAGAGAALGAALGCSAAAAPWLAPSYVARYAPDLVELTQASSGAALQIVLGAPTLLLVWLAPAALGAAALSVVGSALLTRRARRSSAARAAEAAAASARAELSALTALETARLEVWEILRAAAADPRLARVWPDAGAELGARPAAADEPPQAEASEAPEAADLGDAGAARPPLREDVDRLPDAA